MVLLQKALGSELYGSASEPEVRITMKRYHDALIALHWLLAFMIIMGLIMGGRVLSATPNSDPEKLFYLQMHMGMGMAILVLMVIRLFVRFFTQKPPHADIGHAVVNKLGVATHYVFYLVVFLVAGSGLAIANMANLPDIVFGQSGEPLPADFSEYPPRAAHGILTKLLFRRDFGAYPGFRLSPVCAQGRIVLAHVVWQAKLTMSHNIRYEKLLDFVQEIGTIMYVGGILSHIVIGANLGHTDALTAYHVYQYKLISAYVLILPGLGLKLAVDLISWKLYAKVPAWLKIKLAMMTFLAVNAFVFLVPMMPELTELARTSIPAGEVSQAFLDLAHKEQLVGMSNVIPLIVEILMGSFKPRLFSERQLSPA